MKREFEYMNYTDSERLEMLESRAAELERMLGRVTPGYAASEHGTGAYPVQQAVAPHDDAAGAPGYFETAARGRHAAPAAGQWPPEGYPDATPWHRAAGGYGGPRTAPAEYAAVGYDPARFGEPEADGDPGEDEDGDPGDPGDRGYPGYPGYPGYAGDPAGTGSPEADERTEVLINRGRRNVRRPGRAGWLRHWRAIGVCVAAVTAASFLLALIVPGASPSWPASVAQVQSEINAACQNPNVVSEPSQVNFACAKATRQILWVFSLLTSDDNPNFSDPSNGRKGLEPIGPAQGGDVAWSLNLHHPYNPASPTDSLEVAARAINDIIGGATLTGSNGAPVVQPGLESSPANCARYTGSSALVTRQGFPAICAQPVTSPAGQAALVSDVFEQWMVGTPTRIAAEAGVLFENAGNPGDSQVQAILNTLPQSGL